MGARPDGARGFIAEPVGRLRAGPEVSGGDVALGRPVSGQVSGAETPRAGGVSVAGRAAAESGGRPQSAGLVGPKSRTPVRWARAHGRPGLRRATRAAHETAPPVRTGS